MKRFVAISHQPRDDAFKAFRPKSLSHCIRCKQFHMSSASYRNLPKCLRLPIVFLLLLEPKSECCVWLGLDTIIQCAGNIPSVGLVSISNDGQDGAAAESPEKDSFPSFFLWLLARWHTPQPTCGRFVVIFMRI
jgi:hypothetical protein